ncbi:hypothetical protein C8J56DRAFT_223647 [Mycena floridula]|nr:hypothetical protein C8J56DRAFT_223647 [Mycena floridula]
MSSPLTDLTAYPLVWTVLIALIALCYAKYIINRSRSLDCFKLSGLPPPKPLPHFQIDAAKPRPYRPFRWEYHQNMSLTNMEPDWWIELESTYRYRVAQRKKLYALHNKGVIDFLPGSEASCSELAENVISFLCIRYPNQFKFNPKTGIFRNNILNRTDNVNTMHPLVLLLEHVPEDFLITEEDPKTGLYMLRAAVSCSQVGWDLRKKIGRPLHEIHEPVPDYKEKMQPSMDRYFSKMTADKPIQRGSWGLEVGKPLYLQSDNPEFATRLTQSPELDEGNIYLRVDWQTLRRFPRSRCIVFNFKALFTPLTEFRREPYIPALLLKILREGKKELLQYKGTFHIQHVAIPALERWAAEQEEEGVVPKGWKVRTLDESPFFPGWETKQ